MNRRFLIATLSCAALLLFWEIGSRQSEALNFLLPPPSRIASTFYDRADRLWFHALATLKEMGAGFLLALLFAFPLGWWMASFNSVKMVLQPFFVTIQCIPMFALAPLMVLWLGWSFLAVVVSTALMIFFPLTINICQGLSNTPKPYKEFFLLNGATAWQTLFHLKLPYAAPFVFAGFRISVAMAGIGAVAGEWAGAQQGLGVLMMESRRAADMDMMFAALITLVMMSLFLYGSVLLLENRIVQKGLMMQSKSWIALLSTFLICGCSQPAEKTDTVKLVLDWLPNPNHVPIYVGIEKGYFEEEGIPLIVYKVPDQSDSVPYLVSRQADVALSYMAHTILAQRNGVKIQPIGILIAQPLNGVIYRTGEGINSVEDLNGKRIGYSPDGFGTRFLQIIFQNKGVVPSEINNVAFDLVTAIRNKHVDALYGAYWNIECENLRALGLETDYFPTTAFDVPRYYELIFLVNNEGQFSQKEFVDKFQSAMQKSIDYAASHPQEAFAIYSTANPDKSQATRNWEERAWEKTIPTLASNQTIDPIVWNNYVDWLQDHHLIENGK